MKLLAFILLSFLWLGQSSQNDKFLDEWNEFQVKYSKSYRSTLEARKRFAIFVDNLEQINVHNALFHEGKRTYTKGINQFSDWTVDEVMQYVNGGLLETIPKSIGTLVTRTKGFRIPESIDWREKNGVTAVKAQLDCSSCWAFSAVGVIESQLLIRKGEYHTLSEQNLIDCDTWCRGCRAGWPEYGIHYVQDNGIESEQDYPYLHKDGQCNFEPSKSVVKVSNIGYLPFGDEAVLQEVISTKGPVSVLLHVTPNFSAYQSGVFSEEGCPHNQSNHALLAVGFGSENGQEYYIIKNSWGAEWGESGYIRLARNDDNMCGVADAGTIADILI